MNDEQLTQRLRAASEAIEMSDSAQAQHLEAISAALATGAGAADGTVVPLSTAGAGRRRRIVASLVAAAVIAPAGLAAASEGSIPGDALYPVKQLSERVLVLFDSDVIARHRIEEIEALDTAGQFDPELYDDAREALIELGEDHPLWERLTSSTKTTSDPDDRDEPTIEDDDRSELEPADDSSLDTETTDRDDDDDDTPSTANDPDEDESEGDDSAGDDAKEDESEGDESEGGDSAASDDDASEDPGTGTSTPSEDDDGADSGDDDPEDEEDDPGDDDPSEDA